MAENKLNKTQFESLKEIIVSESTLSRAALASKLGETFGGKRDTYEVFGYTKELKYSDYLLKYKRQDIAKRIIAAFPDAVWTKKPSITDDEDSTKETELEKQFAEMAKKLKLFHYLNRVDKLSRLGEYAVLLVGVADGNDFAQPLGKISVDKIAYLMPFSQSSAQITKFVEDPANPRYGLPETYTINTGGQSASAAESSTVPSKSLTVHHSRVIHVANSLLENETFGNPMLQPIFNRLEDLEKIVGGSAEIFWQNGRGGLHLNAPAGTQVADKTKLAQEAEDYVHQLSRILKTKGMEVTTLEMEVASPKDHFEVIINVISGTTGIPKRILLGSERGELSSTQDEGNWYTRIEEERDNYCEPQILRPFVDMMMMIGALPESDDYSVVWPELVSASEESKADVATKKSNAIATYANSMGSDLLIPPQQFVEDVMGMEYREADIKKLMDDEDREIREEEKEIAKEKEIEGVK